MPLTNYALQKVLQNVFGDVALTVPTTFYIGLSSTTPTQVSTSNWNFTEPTIGTNNYARISVTNNYGNGSNFFQIASEPTSGYSVQNDLAFTFAASSGAWAGGAVFTYAGIWDASTAGNLWAYGALSPTVQVSNSGYSPSFAVGQLIITAT